MRLAGKRIVVTGSTGIAAASASLFASEGASVFAIARRSESLAELAGRISAEGGEIGWAEADLTDETATAEAFASFDSRHDRLDGLLAVAGGSGRRFGDGPADGMHLEGWAKTHEINGDPTFLATSNALRRMKVGGGSVVIITSVLAEHPVPDLFATHAYAAAKGAANSFARTLAAYYAPHRVRVNALAPGLVTTPMAQRAAEDPETVEYAKRKQPLADGFLAAESIAAAALFLLSDDSAQITGQVLSVDGGWGVTEA